MDQLGTVPRHYNQKVNSQEPYTVSEFIDITIKDGVIEGTKTGTQNGPDITNGYSGTLIGTINKGLIEVIFSYTIEGSSNKERELHRTKKDLTGLEKLRYPLKEESGLLVPDTTKQFKVIFYQKIDYFV